MPVDEEPEVLFSTKGREYRIGPSWDYGFPSPVFYDPYDEKGGEG